MNTKHILLTSALVVSALAFTSCEDFLDTSSKKDLNTETAYSNLESAEMALVRWRQRRRQEPCHTLPSRGRSGPVLKNSYLCSRPPRFL